MSSRSTKLLTYNTVMADELDAAVFVLAAALVADTYITCMLCYALQHSRTGFRSTGHIITRLFNYIVSRGVLLCAISVILLVMYCLDARNNTCYSEIFQAPSGTLYANSLLAMLNVRNYVKQGAVNEPAESLSLPPTGSQSMT
ncbi:uncharacterized protein B0H18DRAFT_685530 [Fomitopsis serialis]|uniref:uncharacterized protein n=1 Tax=Fomitopsis serialis TaxID=139415 RepID=UPI0020081B9A|nr:uncharacterized protein B0H18DRAFT_685530 [Neoantrodia serialis]KAH9917964.1 hypothetical protein B0H18DRAFT_685530 [Neoantrodia serialis]